MKYGLKVSDPGSGKLRQAGVPKDFIIVKVNNQFVESDEDLARIISKLNQGDGLLIQGFRANGKADYFAFGL
jgi:S1-C subfamily serine protease